MKGEGDSGQIDSPAPEKSTFKKPSLIRVYEWRTLTTSHYLIMFGVHWSGASGDITYFICHGASQEHVLERSYDGLGRSPSMYVTTLPRLLAMGIAVGEIKCL